jgi:peptidyl-prolyl cis-trans isomerase SurA
MFSKVVGLFAVTISLACAADVRIVEEIVAKVNGDIVTRGELTHDRQLLEQELRSQGLSGIALQTELNQRSKDLLGKQIDQLLLVAKGKDLDLKIENDVARRLAEIQVQSHITDPDKFHDWIREQAGMPFEDFKQQLTNQMLTQKVISEEIGSRINIPDAELRKYYDEHKNEFVREDQIFLSQIVISTEGKTPEQVAAAQKKAADLVARARSGEKFSDLARSNSDDPDTARNGGELPPYKRSENMLRKEIADVVFKMKKGAVTDPIKIQNPPGLLILRVDEHYEAGQASFDEVKDEIMQKLATPLMEPKVRDYLTKLRQDAFLEIKPGYVDSFAAPGKDTTWKDVVELKPQTVTKEEVRAQHKKKLLGVVPIGGGKKPAADNSSSTASPSTAPAATPQATPSATPQATPPNQ